MDTHSPETRDGALWGARFASGPAPTLTAISSSPDAYFRLLPHDVAGSRAHAVELGREGLLASAEVDVVLRALDDIERDWLAGDLPRDPAAEDVHGFLEQELIARVGEVGGKVRAGRSRNDQTANDLRLLMRQEARTIHAACSDLVRVLVDLGEQHADTVCLGFTHLQAAQPITFGHQLLSHAQALTRDLRRLARWDRDHAISPLGAAALAGSGVTSHPEAMAEDLGYARSHENSIDAVAARDHVSEFLFAAAQLMVSISRIAEEQILWASPQFGWIGLHDSHATGSSIMPQKRNPDVAELSRGKAGTMLGILSGFMTTQKGLPTAYNRDLFEDKAAVLHAIDILALVLPAMTGSIATMEVRTAAMQEQATLGHALATDVADMLARDGVPFREAHEIVGAVVQRCDELGVTLAELGADDLDGLDSRVTVAMVRSLDAHASLERRRGMGSARPQRVREQAAALRERLLHDDALRLEPLVGRALRRVEA